MLKVMIVDDEALVRIGIKSCLHWNDYGFEVVGLAGDGLEAQKLIAEKAPDIVITDIKMQNMDGIELLIFIKNNFPWIKVIVLSCYDDFDYVKKAMKLGAEDYILKLSIQPENLINILTDIKKRIEIERAEEKKRRALEDKFRLNESIIKSDIFKKYLNEHITEKQFQEELGSLNVDMGYLCYFIIYCEFDENHYAAHELLKDREKEKRNMQRELFINTVNETAKNSSIKVDIAEMDLGKYVIIFGDTRRLKINQFKEICSLFCARLNDSLLSYFNMNLSFGVSAADNDIGNMQKRYKEAYTAFQYKFYSGKRNTVFFDSAGDFDDKKLMLGRDEKNSLINAIQQSNGEEANQIIDSYISGIIGNKPPSPFKLKTSMIEVIRIAEQAVQDMIGINTGIGDEDFQGLILNMADIVDLEQYIRDYINAMAAEVSGFQKGCKSFKTAEVKKYIIDHIDEKLTLDQIAKLNNLSRAYFSTIFKKETGENFIDFVNKAKMERAKDLIVNCRLNANEAAERVGIYDEAYFSKLFKRYIGINPSYLKIRKDQ